MSVKKISIVILAGLSVTACGMIGNDGKYAPDAFEVVDRAPLVIPPESELRPPRPGQPRAQELDPGQQAYEALFPGKTLKKSERKSNGELVLLMNVGDSEPDIRSELNKRDEGVVKKTLLLAEILDADERQYAPDNVSVRRVSGKQ
ncbi:hypothetical protein GCM10017044_09300 [Kordiimonas sediminis]|uniref:DUF3035 domain-containing protein n=1 Tax=Kordiimonas sediminis TaxID=1735581 RepID=A0A919APK1_9PROT|nr:DUF3035 domain-containing protein [Kordiimonas sediminis]GHF17081.1 hypothetical protein GCM10017044_09300 [Kordiimonas sediminis]